MSLILANARVHGRGNQFVDVVLREGRIAALQPAGTSAAGTGPGEPAPRRLDLDGATVLPGLWDHHTHMSTWAKTARRLDLSGTASAAETVALVRSVVEERPDAERAHLLTGFGFSDSMWPDAPVAGALDEGVLASTPVVLYNTDLHSAWANRAAMALAGQGEHPGGLLRETETAVLRGLDDVDQDTADQWVLDVAHAAAARGVVGVVDLEGQGAIEGWERRSAAVALPLRVEANVRDHSYEAAAARGLRTGSRVDEAGLVHVGPLKIITDGSLGTRTAFCHDPYPGSENHGWEIVPVAELEELVRHGAELGFTPAIHAIGDAANTAALDVFERVGVRGAIEHAQLMRESDVRRMAALGVVASVQPEHLLDDRDQAERYWQGRTHRAFPLREMIDAGVQLALGSDAPVTPLDPWLNIQAAAQRTRDERGPWIPEQRISVTEAIAASTRTGGVVALGDPADLVVVPDPPEKRSGAALREMPVALTVLGGRITYADAAFA